MKSKVHYVFAVAALMLLAACETFGPAPETFNERLAVGYTSVTGVRTTTTSLLTAGKIDVKDAQNVQNTADDVREGLDVARDLHKSLPGAGDDKLAQTLVVLRALQTYVKEKE